MNATEKHAIECFGKVVLSYKRRSEKQRSMEYLRKYEDGKQYLKDKHGYDVDAGQFLNEHG